MTNGRYSSRAPVDVNSYVDFAVLRNVVVVAFVAGVGLTVLVSVAARSMANASAEPRSAAGQRLIAMACLLVAAIGVAIGLWAVLKK
jgi:hypothetical protein